jgi:hypothetical protein
MRRALRFHCVCGLSIGETATAAPIFYDDENRGWLLAECRANDKERQYGD